MTLFGRWRKRAEADNAFLQTGDLSVRVARTASGTTVAVSGRVNIDSSPHLRSLLLQLLRKEASQTVIIDLSKTSYLDTSGVATLLEALKAARQRPVKLHLIGVSGQVKMLAEILEVAQIFRAAGSEVVFS